MTWRIGVDIGGTFTDFALLEEARGRIWVHKQLTTPDAPAIGGLDGLQALLPQAGVSIAQVGPSSTARRSSRMR